MRDKTPLELLEEKINVKKLLDSVYLDEDRLVDAALEQPKLMRLAGSFRVQMMHKRVMLETRLDTLKAEIGLKLRERADKRFTIPEIKDRVELNKHVQALQKELNDACALEELSKNLLEVFRTRSDSLRIIVNAGKLTVHMKELELLQLNKKLQRSVIALRRDWLNKTEDDL